MTRLTACSLLTTLMFGSASKSRIFSLYRSTLFSVGVTYSTFRSGSESFGRRWMWSGSRGALRLPSPLRTARDHFSVMQLKPFVRPLRDAVSRLLTAGYGLVCGNWDGAKPDSRRYLSLRSHATQYGGCATL